MSHNNLEALIARIRARCQLAAQKARLPDPGWRVWAEKDYTGIYVRELKSFIALKKTTQGQEPSFAFPAATEQQIKQTERQLGFSLPPLLRLLYTQIANGGFGPGYGITGAIGGYPFLDISLKGDIAQAYHQAVKEAAEYRQSCTNDMSRDAIKKVGKAPFLVGPDNKLIWEDDDVPSLWPEHLLPLCQWGCNISTYIHTDTGQIFQGMGDPYLFVASSLEEWLERWLTGESLQFL